MTRGVSRARWQTWGLVGISLLLYAGIHQIVFGYHRSLSKRFPFAIYYRVASGTVHVSAVLDCRRDPAWIRKRLQC